MLPAVRWCNVAVFLGTLAVLFSIPGFFAKKHVSMVDDFLRDLHSRESWQKRFEPFLKRLWGHFAPLSKFLASSMDSLVGKIETAAERRVALVSLPIVVFLDVLVSVAIFQLYVGVSTTSALLLVVTLALLAFLYSRRVIKDQERVPTLLRLFLYWILATLYLPALIPLIALFVLASVAPAIVWIALFLLALVLHIALRILLTPYYLLDKFGKPHNEHGLATFFFIVGIVVYFSDRLYCR